jgi:hypothetical protein
MEEAQVKKKAGFFATWLGPIAPENIEKEIKQITMAWYTIAGIQLAISIFLVYLGKFPLENLFDPIALAIGGYFIQSRKSRSVAVVLFLIALAELAVTLAANAGLTAGGRNIWLAIIVVLVGWRSIRATWLFQKIHNAKVNWKRVGWISALVSGLAILLAIISIVGLIIAIPQPTEIMYGLAMLVPILAAVTVGMGLLTKRYPLANLDVTASDGYSGQAR